MSDGEPCSFFMFTVLPFSLSSEPYIFTKLLRPLVKHWRSQGIRAVFYLDDGFDVESTELPRRASYLMTTSQFGFLYNLLFGLVLFGMGF